MIIRIMFMVVALLIFGTDANSSDKNYGGGNTTETTAIAVSQQQQGQQQFQGIDGSGNSSIGNSGNSSIVDSGNSAVTFKDSFNGAKPIRYLPIPTEVSYTGLAPQMFSQPEKDRGAQFIAANNLIGLMGAWSVNELEDTDFDMGDVDIDITEVGKTDLTPEQIAEIDRIEFAVQGSETQKVWKTIDRKVLAIGTIYTDDEEVNSAELFMALAVKAKERGARGVVLLGEGVKIELTSSGWGLGLSYNMATVDSDYNGRGSVGAGGTGVSGGKAGYIKMPYLTFSFLR